MGLLTLVLGLLLVGGATAATPAGPTRPVVKTADASAITYQAANLTGAINPGGQATTYFFQFGTTIKYGSQTPLVSTTDNRTIAATGAATGLLPETTYHYRLVAINALGATFGADATFTTTSIPLSLAITALPNPVTLGSTLSVVGTLTGSGAAGSAVVLQQNPFPFTTGFRILGAPNVVGPDGGFQFEGLTPMVTTQYRVISVGPGPPVVSTALTAFVHLSVTMTVVRRHAKSGNPTADFQGLIAPAQVGARVSVQRLIAGKWWLVAATRAQVAAAGVSTYDLPLQIRHSGYYRVSASPIEGGHVANVSQQVMVHASG